MWENERLQIALDGAQEGPEAYHDRNSSPSATTTMF